MIKYAKVLNTRADSWKVCFKHRNQHSFVVVVVKLDVLRA